ncbi:MAG TPA: nuclear transport factor 2 family protein [Mycobacterium sp.]|nr:nuclear transport factor 2 family protein [Mycobacterium sp.]
MTGTERSALAELVHRYAASVDDRRFDDVIELFAEDAELVVPAFPQALDPVVRHHGHAAIRQALAAVLAVERTEHAIVGEVYADAGQDRARGRITCLAHHFSRHDQQASVLVWHLRYDDNYVRRGQEWLFSRRTLTINATETRHVGRLR